MGKAKVPFLYKWFREYVRFLVERVYYRNVHYLGKENVPDSDTSLLVVSDHQNSMNDAMGLILSMRDRVVHCIVRADVFSLNSFADKFLRAIGLLPAFRMNWEGEQALSNNGATFRDSEKSLLDGNTVVIYPEAGHQNKHWLGTFSYGYTRMAFEAAEMGNFEKEIFILPSCNHYSDYRGLRTDMLIKYGTPISIKPYYELYQTKPRTAQREVNALVRAQIKEMMLSVDDVDNYEAIDCLRNSSYGKNYAKGMGLDPDSLPQKLESDKSLVAALAEAKEANPADVQGIYEDTLALKKDIVSAGVNDGALDKSVSISDIVLQAIVLVVLLPLAAFAVWPSIPCWFIPKYLWEKTEDNMFSGTFLIAINALFLFPVFGILTFIVAFVKFSFIFALIYVALFPALCLFEWAYFRWIREMIVDVKAYNAEKTGVMQAIRTRREKIYGRLDSLLHKQEKQ